MKTRRLKTRIYEASKLLNISRKLKGDDLLFLYENMKDSTRNLFSEIVYNVINNTGSLKLSSVHTRKLKKIMLPHKKEFEFLAGSTGSDNKKMIIIKKQIGGGVFTALVTTLAPIILSLLASSRKK